MTRAILAAVMLCLACASGQSSPAGTFSRNIGLATEAETVEMTRRILTLHQFEIRQEEPGPNLYVETHWRPRNPYADEQALGIVGAEMRAIVRARPRSGTSQMGQIYNVDMVVEQRVRTDPSSDWVMGTLTTSARSYAAELAEDLRTALDVGVRRFGPGG